MQLLPQTAKITFSIAILFIISTNFIACKKFSIYEVGYRVKTETTDSGGTTTYNYDQQGRLVLTEGQGPGGGQTYSYFPGTVLEFGYDSLSTGASDTIQYWALNKQGLAGNNTYPNTPGSGGYNNIVDYTYNAEGYLTSTTFQGSLLESYSYQNDNLISEVSGSTTIKYFYNDKIESRNYGLAFLGSQNKNQLTEKIYFYSSGRSDTVVYTYDYDSLGRIVAYQGSSPPGSSTGPTTTYTYY